MDRQTRRELEERVVRVVEVNMTNRVMIVEDHFQSRMNIALHVNAPVFQVPTVGEIWVVKRKGVNWVLAQRQESGSENKPITQLTEGDLRIETSGDVWINGMSFNSLLERLHALDGL